MIKLGEIQMLEILRITSVGAYLNETSQSSKDDVLLPKKQIPEGANVGDKVEVFVYRDSEDRMIATTKMPKITLGEIKLLRVVASERIGAFLDWGLERDLFLPHKEQKFRIEKGKEYLVSLYIDKSKRLCATMEIYKNLKFNAPYKEGDKVTGVIYEINKDFGAFVAVENKYHGLISNKEFYGNYKYGDTVEARVLKIREDGKLDLSVRQPAYMQMDTDAQVIIEQLEMCGGELGLNDESSPEEIKDTLNMSKKAFKRAVGKLLKEKKIEFTEKGIKMK